MSNETLAIVITAVLAVAALAWTILGHQRLRGTRHLMRGAGLVLLPIGLWLTGVMKLVASGLRAVVDYFRNASLDTMMIAGLVVTALGLLIWFGASMVEPVTRAQSRERRLARAEERRGAGAPAGRQGSAPAVGGQAGGPAAPAAKNSAPKGQQADPDSDDAEIEALLRKRGIE